MTVVQNIHHYSICADISVIEKTKEFYIKILDLTEGFRPNLGIDGYWLYAGEHPILHLITFGESDNSPKNNGCFDHIALRCDSIELVQERLERHNILYDRLEVEEIGQIQFFITDPAGVKVELNFIQ